MAYPPRPLRRAVGLAVLALCAACQSNALERGDAAFRRGDYLGAWHAYEAAGDPEQDEVVAARLARTRWFLVEQSLRRMLASGQEEQAIALLPLVAEQAPPDRVAIPAELEERGRSQLGSRHTRKAEDLLEAGEVEAAIEELTLALTWNAEDDLAANLLAMTTERVEREAHLGEDFYFEGMDHLRHGYDVRARTSFHHAAELLGAHSRAQQRFEGLTQDLAAASRAEAHALLDADLLGPAFFAIRSAERLEPEHPDTTALIDRLQARVGSENALLAGDLAIRGKRTELAEEILAEIAAWDVPAHRAERNALAHRNTDLALDLDYRYGRAFELDEQVVRAAEIYRSILERGQGFGWADSDLRLARLQERIVRAAEAYDAALAAEAAGDEETYRARLIEAVRAASDYADALDRLTALHLEDAAVPPPAEDPDA